MPNERGGEDESQEVDRPTWDHYADSKRQFSAAELIGEIRSFSVREAPQFLDWLAPCLGLEPTTIRQKLAAWRGHGSLRSVFADEWPIIVDAVPRDALGSLTAVMSRSSPALVRWIADIAGLEPQDAFDRVTEAPPTSRVEL